jgi:tetratricopeptide (TPR) repeat protein
MNYRDHLSQALLALGSDDESAALAHLRDAETAAASVDPEGPRVAEVLNYVAQVHSQAGRATEARAALERVAAIWERFPQLAEGLGDYYLQLMALSAQLGDTAAAEAWQARAKAAAAQRPEKPWR